MRDMKKPRFVQILNPKTGKYVKAENDEEWNYVFRRLSDKLKTHMNNIECDIYMVEQHSGRKKGRTNE